MYESLSKNKRGDSALIICINKRRILEDGFLLL